MSSRALAVGVGAAITMADVNAIATITRPVKQLRGFQRVALKPGESKVVTFALGFDDLSMLDDRMQRVVEPGTFTVFVGGSSDATREAKFEVAAK